MLPTIVLMKSVPIRIVFSFFFFCLSAPISVFCFYPVPTSIFVKKSISNCPQFVFKLFLILDRKNRYTLFFVNHLALQLTQADCLFVSLL